MWFPRDPCNSRYRLDLYSVVASVATCIVYSHLINHKSLAHSCVTTCDVTVSIAPVCLTLGLVNRRRASRQSSRLQYTTWDECRRYIPAPIHTSIIHASPTRSNAARFLTSARSEWLTTNRTRRPHALLYKFLSKFNDNDNDKFINSWTNAKVTSRSNKTAHIRLVSDRLQLDYR